MKISKSEKNKIDELRIHIRNMDVGKRILLKDGRIGIFKGLIGGFHTGNTFEFQERDFTHIVPIELYDCTLIDNLKVKCPLCNGQKIMNGLIMTNDGSHAAFRENITTNRLYMPYYNSRTILLNACRDCGYIMPFVKVSQ